MEVIQNGTRFGKLTVVGWELETYFYRGKSKKKRLYVCECECGKKTNVRGYSLKSGRSQSCGCNNKLARPTRRKPDNYALKNSVFKNYRSSAMRRGYKFSLTKEELFEIISKPCVYCGSLSGMIPSHARRLKSETEFRYNGIDRFDNTKGYTLDNCIPACDICNNSKSTLSFESWKDWIQRVSVKVLGSTTIP